MDINIPNQEEQLVANNTKTTLTEELKVLAYNFGSASKWAGFNYDRDVHQGIIIGEQLAICIFQKYTENIPVAPNINIHLLNDTMYTI